MSDDKKDDDEMVELKKTRELVPPGVWIKSIDFTIDCENHSPIHVTARKTK